MKPSPCRVIFMGTPAFAAPTLQALLSAQENVVAVITQPDKPRGRGQKVSPSPVKELAQAHGLPVLQPAKLKDPAFRAGGLPPGPRPLRVARPQSSPSSEMSRR